MKGPARIIALSALNVSSATKPQLSVVGASPQIGQIVTLGPRQGHTLVLSNASRCVIESITIRGASDMAIGEYGGGGANVLRGNRVVRHPTRTPQGLLVSNGDIFMSSGASHGPLVEGNAWSYSGDSGPFQLFGDDGPPRTSTSSGSSSFLMGDGVTTLRAISMARGDAGSSSE